MVILFIFSFLIYIAVLAITAITLFKRFFVTRAGSRLANPWFIRDTAAPAGTNEVFHIFLVYSFYLVFSRVLNPT